MFDYHTHTTFSDGANTPGEMMDEAVRLGITTLAITDHYDPFDPGLSQAATTPEALEGHFASIRALAAERPLHVLCGIETSTGPDGLLRLPQRVCSLCQVIITSVHYMEKSIPLVKGNYFNDAYWSAYKQKLLAQAAGPGHILGHPEGYLPIHPLLEEGTTFQDRLDICAMISRRYFDAPFIDALGSALAASGKAYELHGASSTPREWVVRRLQKQGVRFSVGSDAHSLSLLGCNSRAFQLARDMGLSLFHLPPSGNEQG